MPDHLHGILILHEVSAGGAGIAKHPRRARHAVPLQIQGRFAAPSVGSIPTIVGAFKAAVTRRINDGVGKRTSIWQRGYYEHVIWSEDEFRETCDYIRTNPARRILRNSSS
jgi:putative transposase